MCGKELTTHGVGAGQDDVGSDVSACANATIVAGTLGDGRLVAVAVHACQCHWQVLKQNLRGTKASNFPWQSTIQQV